MKLPNGVYTKTLTATDISQKMSVPRGWVGQGKLLRAPNPGSKPKVILVRDENGRKTILRLAVRPLRDGQERYYMKPVFMSKEWHAFVVEKGLKRGEPIFVWLDQDKLRIKVRVPPSTLKLFGTKTIC